MQEFKLSLFGGRIDCIKFALSSVIADFELEGEHYMTLIYRDMLAEIYAMESEANQ